MTTVQKTLIAAITAAAIGAGVYEARQNSKLRSQVQTLQQQETPLLEQIRQLTQNRDDGARQLASLREDNDRLNRNAGELLKLRSEVTQLGAGTTPKPSAAPASPSEAAAAAALQRQGQMFVQAQDRLAIDGRLLQMKQRLNLTTEQEASVRGILERDPRLRKLKAESTALLTPEQQAAYVQLEQETERDSTRVTACRNALDMVQLLQSNIGLDQQQQDKAFPALMEYGQQKARYDAKRQDYDAYLTAEEDLTQLTLKALKGILTDEQMDIYREYEDQMLKVHQMLKPSEK
jgi:hypothetical protein